MSLKKNDVEIAVGKLNEALEVRAEASMKIRFEGNSIILPSHLENVENAIDALRRHQESMEEEQNKHIEIEGHPSDLLHAFTMATEETFGELIGKPTGFGFFQRPAETKNIEIGPDQMMTVPIGAVEVPGLPIKIHIQIRNGSPKIKGRLLIDIGYKAKCEPLVTMLEEGTKKWLAENPIFKGKAIDSDFNFLHLNDEQAKKIVYSLEEQSHLDAQIFSLIRNREQLREKGAGFKRSILLSGTYGTGKTLTAYLTALECQKNNTTFINVKPGSGSDVFNPLIEFGQKFPPAVVFFEDVDQITSGTRDTDLNEILNTVDGVLSKSSEVMIIMTTNNVNRIQQAMKRPGRIDTILEIGKIDSYVLNKMISTSCEDAMDYRVEELLESVKGYTPAFIIEGCKRAILYAHTKGSDNITHDDLEGAFKSLRLQYNIMKAEVESDEVTIDSVFKEMIKRSEINLSTEIDEAHSSQTSQSNDISTSIESTDNTVYRIEDAIEQLDTYVRENV